MNRYVLEILDGEQAGTVVELGEQRLVLGRKPDCDFVLRDEKCSGHHAEIVFEDGRHVLRDLGSTNGTMLDGRRVQEVVLSPRDEFVLGRVRAVYRAADDAAGGAFGQVQVGHVDAARLAHSSRRRGSLLWTGLFVAVLAAGGLFAWRTWFAGESGGGPAQQRPMQIAGNRLPQATADFEAADVEGDGGWDLQPVDAAAPFDVLSGRTRAHSGSAALSAAGIAAEEGAEPRVFAVARTVGTLPVTSGQALTLVAHVQTVGAGRALLRAVFGAGDAAELLRSGTAPVEAADGWREVRLALSAPRGAESVAVELVAWVPGPDDEVRIDDVGVVFGGDAAAVAGAAGGTMLVGTGASVRVEGTTVPTLLGVTPLVGDDPLLGTLQRHGLLVPSDAGLQLAVAALDGEVGYRLSWTGAPVRGLALALPPESADCRTRGADDGFAVRDPAFEADGVAVVLCGSADNRATIGLPEPRTVRAEPRPGAWRVELVGATSFDLRVVFTDEAVRGRELLRAARFARDEERLEVALASIDELVRTLPHDVRSLREAQQIRGEILARQEREVDALLREGGEAEFFDARVGYQRVTGAVDDLLARYGADNVPRAEELEALRGRMQAGIAALDAREGQDRAELLRVLADAFEEVGNTELAAFVRDYVDRRLPKEGK